ncbi:hypothetical protein HDU87_006956 [Geranomyces variabilis]|uniref:PROP1-like PPR domain-containing protein n=1 Tax=Geranomyces variabilis TaxID=109894 RepID=A0AAD5XK30_9FUNG|nr:hypothetical protein HDU87_006956 [Geranomyces variabilis]
MASGSLCALKQPNERENLVKRTNRYLKRFLSDVETTSLLRFESLNTVDWPQQARRLWHKYQAVKQRGLPLDATHAMHLRALIAVLLRGKLGHAPVAAVMRDMKAINVRLGAQDWGRLITAFGRAGELDLAVQTLNQLQEVGDPKPDTSCYNGVIEAYAERGDCKMVFRVLRSMHVRGVCRTYLTAILLVDAHLNADDAKGAKKYWQRVVQRYGVSRGAAEKYTPHKIPKHRMLQTYHELIDRACKRGEMREAMRFYNGLVVRGTTPVLSTFALLLAGFVQQRDQRGAQMLLERMRFMRVKPDVRIYSTLIDLHGKLGRLDEATRFLRLAVADGIEPDVALLNILINAYGIAGDLDGARNCYDMIIARGLSPDRWTFATLVHAHMRGGDATGAHRWLELAEERLDRSVSRTPEQLDEDRHADAIILAALIEGNCRMGDLQRASALMAEMREKGLPPLAEAFTSLISANLRIKDIEGAARWFDEMKAADVDPDSQVYGMMIAAYTRIGKHTKAAALMASMTETNVAPSGRTAGILIVARIRAGEIDAAMAEYERLVDLGCEVPLKTLPPLIFAFANHRTAMAKSTVDPSVDSSHRSLMALFRTYLDAKAREGVTPDSEAYDALVAYLLSKGLLDQAKSVAGHVLADACAEPQIPLLRIARRILDNHGWTALREWNAEIKAWLVATKRKQYARRRVNADEDEPSPDNEVAMQWLWKDGLLAETDIRVEKHTELIDTQAKVIEKTILQSEVFSYGEHVAGKVALGAGSKHYDEVVAAFADDLADGEKPRDEVAVSAYWDAVLALRRLAWPGSPKPVQQPTDTVIAEKFKLALSRVPPHTRSFQKPGPRLSASDNHERAIPSFLLAAPAPFDRRTRAMNESVAALLSALREADRTLPARLAARRDHPDPHFGPPDRDEDFVAFCAGLLRYCESRHFWRMRKTVWDELRARGWELGEAGKGFGPHDRAHETTKPPKEA